ncbi:MAG: ABC transporter ATP-binding protein [Rikenellaceae bacterium]
MIKATNIYKKYGELEVLKGVSLEVQRGEVISITGSSGAGKTTLLHIISTLATVDSGSVLITDEDVTRLDDKQLSAFRNNKIGFVFQFHNLLPEFTALENVMIPGLIGKRNRSEVEQRAMELLELMGLSERYDHKPNQLSGGEQQRVAIARAIINSPEVIFADEPSGNLDSLTKEDIHKLFFRLRDEFGITVIVVTHDEKLAEMADRKIVMRDGVII